MFGAGRRRLKVGGTFLGQPYQRLPQHTENSYDVAAKKVAHESADVRRLPCSVLLFVLVDLFVLSVY